MKMVRSRDLPWGEALNRGSYGQRRKGLGGEKLSCSLFELQPGKRSFPFHAHHLTEEALYVISGCARVRTPDGITDIGPGDFVCFPAGGQAHQLINDGAEPMVYLAMSAGVGLDVVEYPDSGKVACAVGKPPGGKRLVFREASQVDYFDGEKDAER